MREKLVIILILFNTGIYAQLNLDSLFNEVITLPNFEQSDTIQYLRESAIRYERKDGSETFDFFLDSVGNLEEYIGLCAIHTMYDSPGRVTKRIGYNLAGNYYLWHFSPIALTNYRATSTQVDYLNYLNNPTDTTVTIHDSRDRQI